MYGMGEVVVRARTRCETMHGTMSLVDHRCEDRVIEGRCGAFSESEPRVGERAYAL